MKMTKKSIEAIIPPTTGRDDYRDSDNAGLVLRVSNTGARSFSFSYRFKGTLRRLNIGKYPSISISAAQAAARDARTKIEKGIDPVQEKKDAELKAKMDNYPACVKQFLAEQARKVSANYLKDMERLLNVPAWSKMAVEDIRRRDITYAIKQVGARAPGRANHFRSYLSSLFKFLVRDEVIKNSPVIGTERYSKLKARTRILDEEEIITLWMSTRRISQPFGAAVRMLLLTGCRLNEIARLRWSEISPCGNWLLLPGSRMKNGKNMKVPLSTLAKVELAAQPRYPDCDWVYTCNGQTPVRGWTHPKAKLAEHMEKDLGHKVAQWQLHDLRRTCATGLASLDVRAEVIKRVLGHTPSATDVTATHYNHFGYDKAAAVALQQWADYITGLTAPKLIPAPIVEVAA